MMFFFFFLLVIVSYLATTSKALVGGGDLYSYEQDEKVSTIPHILWFSQSSSLSSQNPIESKEPWGTYKNVQYTISRYRSLWDKAEAPVHFLDSVACAQNIRSVNPSLSHYYDKEVDEQNKIDMCRIASLYLRGGYHFDVMTQVVEPFRPEENTTLISALSCAGGCFPNYFLASTPKNAMLESTLKMMIKVYETNGETTMLGPVTTANAYYSLPISDRQSVEVLPELQLDDNQKYPLVQRIPGKKECSEILHDPEKDIIYFFRVFRGNGSCEPEPHDSQFVEIPVSDLFDTVEPISIDFSTKALAEEVVKHDRMIVDAMVYMRNFDTDSWKKEMLNVPTGTAKELCIVVMTINRTLPYIDVLLSMLLRGQKPAHLLRGAEVHVMNTERRQRYIHYRHFSELREMLPFFHFHDLSDWYDEHKEIDDDVGRFLSDQKLDYIKALEACEGARSKWCIILEDDAVPTKYFLGKFKKYVTQRYESNPLEEWPMIKLYVAHNPVFKDMRRNILDPQYSRRKYDLERFQSGRGRDEYYIVPVVKQSWGIVANAYPAPMVSKLKSAIASLDSRNGPPLDVFINNDFLTMQQQDRLGVSPSMINHIGYLSEHHPEVNDYTRISTDVRFGWEE